MAEQPIPLEVKQQLLEAFTTMAMNWPDNPVPLMTFASKQSKHAILETVKFGMPPTWYNIVDQLFASLTDEQARAFTALFSMSFVQGAGMRRMQKSNGR